MQEAIILILQKLRQANFVLTSSLKTYLFASAENLWLKRLRDDKHYAEEEVFEIEARLEKSDEQKEQTW